MKRNLQFAVLTLAVAGLIFRCLHPRTAQGVVNSKPDDLLLASEDELTQHAQQIFAEYTAGRTIPAWETDPGWFDQCDVGLLLGCRPAPDNALALLTQTFRSFQVPPQIQANGRGATSPNGTFPRVLQSIYYNRSARDAIRGFSLSDGQLLKKRLDRLQAQHVALEDQGIQDFSRSSVVVKTIWETITPVEDTSQLRGKPYAQIYLFENDPPMTVRQDPTSGVLHYDPISVWNQTDPKFVNLHDTAGCSLAEDQGYQIYSLGCFRYRTVTAADFRIPHQNQGEFPDLLRPWCNSEQCFMILVGVHIMTRETPNWVWMTFWWTDALHRSSVADIWSYFGAKASVNNFDLISNPYLEGTSSSGITSNCMECHRYAAVPHVALAKLHGIPCDDPGARILTNPESYFGQVLQTHFLWTIALAQPNTIEAPQGLTCSPPTSRRPPDQSVIR